jgi:hypothetical protein
VIIVPTGSREERLKSRIEGSAARSEPGDDELRTTCGQKAGLNSSAMFREASAITFPRRNSLYFPAVKPSPTEEPTGPDGVPG